MTHKYFQTVAGVDDTSAGDATELKRELDEVLDCCFVSFLVDQYWSLVGTIGDLAFGVVFLYLVPYSDLDCILDDICLTCYLCEVAIVSQLFIPFLFSTWDCVKITPLATNLPCGYASRMCPDTWEI